MPTMIRGAAREQIVHGGQKCSEDGDGQGRTPRRGSRFWQAEHLHSYRVCLRRARLGESESSADRSLVEPGLVEASVGVSVLPVGGFSGGPFVVGRPRCTGIHEGGSLAGKDSMPAKSTGSGSTVSDWSRFCFALRFKPRFSLFSGDRPDRKTGRSASSFSTDSRSDGDPVFNLGDAGRPPRGALSFLSFRP